MVIDGESGTIGARLASVVAQVPDNIAVVENDSRVSYREFDEAATAIAHYIVSLGNKGQGRVGLFFDRKLMALQSMFGAARSGHTYVPLDASDPEDRLRFILQDCEPVALLTEAALVERARSIAPADCVVIDIAQIPAQIPRIDASPALPEVAPDQCLVLCYTSGSTGRPKGVGQTHRNIICLTSSYARSLGIDAPDRLSLLYTMSFAAASNDLYAALLCGATLCAYNVRRDGMAGLADWLDRERITVLHTVPTVFRELCSRLAPERVLPYLKAIDVGGETVFASDLEQYKAHTLPHCRFLNQLASTELQLIAQYLVGHDTPLPAGGIVPVGRSPDGVVVNIRRTDGSEADTEEAGEIVVSSRYVSPGYWRRPDLGAAVFAQSARYPGWREYKGGDRGRIDADGNLHFLGREGGRVKIRGHSVDLMEVEAALAVCPGVLKAAVLAPVREGQRESERLVAYVVTLAAEDRVPQILRRHLSGRLPWYMVPAGMAFVDDLPLTASGKVDRTALSRVELSSELPEREIDPPRDDVEQAVAGIFANLLNITPVGRDDDFFLLGGDSLMGAELQTLLAQQFDVHVGSFHEDATVARIAGNIRRETARPASERRSFPALRPLWQQGSATPMFLVHGRNGQAFVSPHFMRLLGNEQPVWVFQARGLGGMQEPHTRVQDMAFDYLAELRKQRPHGPYFIASLCAGALIAAIMARSLLAAGETVLPLLLLDPPDQLIRQTSPESLLERLKQRRETGQIGPVGDRDFLAARRVGMAFDEAIAKFRPQPYDGQVFVLSSQQRALAGDVAALRKMFPGHMDRYVVGTTHKNALDPHNPAFASALQECLARIHQAAVARPGMGRDAKAASVAKA